MQSMKRQRNLYFKYGTCTPDREFRTIYVDGVPKVVTIREAVKYKERRVKEIEAQKKQIQECRAYNLKSKAIREKQIEECRAYNLKRKAENYNPRKISIKDMIAHINKMGTI